jgi:hypothetical protein
MELKLRAAACCWPNRLPTCCLLCCIGGVRLQEGRTRCCTFQLRQLESKAPGDLPQYTHIFILLCKYTVQGRFTKRWWVG